MLLIWVVRRAFQGGGVGLIVLGIISSILAIAMFATVDDPTCGGESMTPGTECRYDTGTVKSYEEERSDARTGSMVMGSLFGVGALVLFGVGASRLGRTSSSVRSTSVPHSPPSAPMWTPYAAQVAGAAQAQRASSYPQPGYPQPGGFAPPPPPPPQQGLQPTMHHES